MAENQSSSTKRPGPVSFNAETGVTSNRIEAVSDPRSLSVASTPKLETPRGSKELKVMGPYGLVFLGVFLVVSGLIISLILTLVGLVLLVLAFVVGRENKIQRRLRNISRMKRG